MKVKKNFTMLELLLAMAIIVVLIGLGVGGYNYAMHASREAATKSTMKQLETALESMKAKHGFYPPASAAKNFYVAYPANAGDAATANGLHSTEHKAYMEDFVKVMDLDGLGSRGLEKVSGQNYFMLIDAWGKPIWYISPGRVNKNSFDLISFGADGKIADGVTLSNYTGKNDFVESDDLTNF
jgi:type II secretory pathway pseudopilin PulG